MSRPASARLAIAETFWAHSLAAESRSSCLGRKIHIKHTGTFLRDCPATNTQAPKNTHPHVPVHGSPSVTSCSDGCQHFLPRLRLFGRQVIQMNFARPHGVDRATQVEEDLIRPVQIQTQVNEVDLEDSARKQRRVCICRSARSRFCIMHGDFRVSAVAPTMNAHACEFVPYSHR
jgi:hypothetical protein